MMGIATHRIRVGGFQCLVVKDGTTSSTPLRELMADPLAELADQAIRMLVVDTPAGRVMIDSGNGPHRGEKAYAAEAALAAAGIAPESVDAILLTHGDFDHIGGLIDGAGKLAYPNARYVLHRELWDFWSGHAAIDEYPEEAASLLRRILTPVRPAVEERGTLFDNEHEVFAGITAVPALGHRHGHALYLIESAGEKLLHIGDAAVHPVFLEYPGTLNIRHDTNREMARDSRRMLVARAVAEGAMVVGTHFELPGIGRLTESGEDRYTWHPVA